MGIGGGLTVTHSKAPSFSAEGSNEEREIVEAQNYILNNTNRIFEV